MEPSKRPKLSYDSYHPPPSVNNNNNNNVQQQTEADFLATTDDRLPQNTKKQMFWAAKKFYSWRNEHNKQTIENDTGERPYDCLQLEEMPSASLDEQISRFIVEARQANGAHYAGSSINALIDMLSKYISIRGKLVSLRTDVDLPQIRLALDCAVRISSVAGSTIGSSVSPVDEAIQNAIFEKGLVSWHNPLLFFRLLVWLIGMHTGCRGYSENRRLTFKSFELLSDKRGRQYFRVTFPSNSGKTAPKIKYLHPVANAERCPVRAVKFYLSLVEDLMSEELAKSCFYLRPLVEIRRKNGEKDKWFAMQPVGEHNIAKVIPSLMKAAGFGESEESGDTKNSSETIESASSSDSLFDPITPLKTSVPSTSTSYDEEDAAYTWNYYNSYGVAIDLSKSKAPQQPMNDFAEVNNDYEEEKCIDLSMASSRRLHNYVS